jgi:hypothetical protein
VLAMVFSRLLDGTCVCADAAPAKKSAKTAVATRNISTPQCSRLLIDHNLFFPAVLIQINAGPRAL